MTDRPTMLLLHAGVADSGMWARQIGLLEKRYRVLAPYTPGFGATPEPPGAFAPIDWAASQLDGPSIVVGNSFGGRLALELALVRPELVEGLALIAPAIRDHTWSDELERFGAREEELVEAGDLDAAVEVNMEFWVQPHMRDFVRPMQRRALELQLGAEEPLVWPEELPPFGSLDAPTLIVVGDRDVRDFVEIAERLASELPNARLEVVHGAGHLPSLEAPDAFDRLLLEFLEHGI
ncbi:MAG: alpha/beta fold hydrolase [Gaiellaceae bacterium]